MENENGPNIAENVARVRERIDRACQEAGRSADDVTLVAVTKTQTPARVADVIRAGVAVLGENYVQEAREKIPQVAALCQSEPGLADVKLAWHLVGHLQSNKAKYSVRLFSLTESVYNLKLAQEIAGQALKQGQSDYAVLVEVNLSGDPARFGVAPDAALVGDLCAQIAETPGLALRGLMGIAPWGADSDDSLVRNSFSLLRRLWESLPEPNRRILSMGMSNDFEAAIAEGATEVRIGTALFGARPAKNT